MYGTVAKLHVRPEAEPLFQAWLNAVDSPDAPGRVSMTMYRSQKEPGVYWMAVVFESVEAYRANAESSRQDQRYRQLRSVLDGDPEWHDGEVVLRFPR